MVEAAGVEPASKAKSNKSHSQVWPVYYHKLAKLVGYNLTLTDLLH